MISRTLYILEQGVHAIRDNSKLLFLAAVLFVLPLLFTITLEQFYAVAKANIQTAELERIATLHDSISILLSGDQTSLRTGIKTLYESNSDTRTIKVFQLMADNEQLLVIAADNPTELQTTATTTTLLQLGMITPGETFQVPLVGAEGRLEQAVRFVEVADAQYFIFSEHDRQQIDTVLNKRKQDAYIVLSLLFIVIIALAYWINQQSDWKRKYTKLQSTLEDRDLFSNMIAHEFRTPLTAIKGYASFLQESNTLASEERRYADTIRDSAERLVLLVNDFLEVARIQSGRMKLTYKEVDMRTAIQTVIDSLASAATEKNLSLVYTPNLKPQIVSVDDQRLTQILTNIISNSIKYTDTGTVEVSCEADRTGVTIRVKDTGMGISAQDQKKLFAPFSRVGGVEHTTTTGTGLGMWITKQMIELLGGTIAVESIKDVGTHVVLHFARDPR